MGPDMEPSVRGSLRLFQVLGIDVYLHWSWFLIAALQISRRPDDYDAPVWKVIEYLSLFGIVLLHEFGHALACRSVGGEANHIVLWPLGGVAYVAPPPRPTPLLWSIAAGPLVNVALAPLLCLAWWQGGEAGWPETQADLMRFVKIMTIINFGLLFFNLLPIYPLDGGQILRALLWYGVGRRRSLLIVSVVGLVLGTGVAVIGAFGMLTLGLAGSPAAVGLGILGILGMFVAVQSWIALQQSHGMLTVEALPRHNAYRCPECGTPPPRGPFWVCVHCQTRFDLFVEQGKCPGCGAWYLHPDCSNCRNSHHIDQWPAPQQTAKESST
jgi:Zn-dependent protease